MKLIFTMKLPSFRIGVYKVTLFSLRTRSASLTLCVVLLKLRLMLQGDGLTLFSPTALPLGAGEFYEWIINRRHSSRYSPLNSGST